MTKVQPRVRAIAWLLSLAYFASYVMRINFSVVIVEVCADLGKQKEEIAFILTALTIAYGLGQILCGIVGDKIKPRVMLTGGLALAIACNVAMFFTTHNVILMAVIWGINGFAHSMFWPPIVKLMAMHLSEGEYAYASVRVTWGSSIATILLYLTCPFLLFVMKWNTIMLLCALIGSAIMVAWVILCPKLFKESKEERKSLVSVQENVKKPPSYVFLPLALIMVAIIMQGALRDGVTAWMPSYLVEAFAIPSKWSILITVVLAVFSMISFTVFDYINRRFFKNEVFCAGFIFALATMSAVMLFVSNVLGIAIPSIILMSILVACMHGTNLMLIAIAPKRFKNSGKVSTYSGIMNACTYVGAAVSTYAFAALATAKGWGVVIGIWIGVSFLGCALCFTALPKWRKFKNEFDIPDGNREE